jgi:hypothetical protein
MSPSDLLPAPSAPAQTDSVELCYLLDDICCCAREVEVWEADLNHDLSELTVAREQGKVGNIVEHQGWNFCWSPGETDYEWPASIIKLEASLQEAKAAAVAAGTAVQMPSTPFWIVRRPKASQEAA